MHTVYVGPEGTVATDGRRLALILPPKELPTHDKEAKYRLSPTEGKFLIPKDLIDIAKKSMVRKPKARYEWIGNKRVEVGLSDYQNRRMDVVDLEFDPRVDRGLKATIKTPNGDVKFQGAHPEGGDFPNWQGVIADYFPEGKFPANNVRVAFDAAYVEAAMKLLREVQKERGFGWESKVRMDVRGENDPIFFWTVDAVVMVMPIEGDWTDKSQYGDRSRKLDDANFPIFQKIDCPAEKKKADEAKAKAEAERLAKEEARRKERAEEEAKKKGHTTS